MSNPLGQQRKNVSQLGLTLSASEFRYTSAVDWEGRRLPLQSVVKRPEYALEKFKGLDMMVMSSVRIPSVSYAPDQETMQRIMKGDDNVLYTSAKDGLNAGIRRTGALVGVAQAVAAAWDYADTRFPFTREDVKRRMSTVCAASGGSQFTLTRFEKSYPRRGVVVRPPMKEEVARAASRSYVAIGPLAVHSNVRLNPTAEMGFPFGGKGEDGEKLQQHELLRASMRPLLEEKGGAEAYRQLMESEPHLVLFKGKAKYDVYKLDKLVGGEMRFYNVLPGWLKLELMSVTQSFEDLCLPGLWTFQGESLSHGGAEAVVRKLDRNLEEKGYAWLTCGDDTWAVLARPDGTLLMFSVDLSHFDLTQHSLVTEPIHEHLRSELSRVDKVAADLWHAAMRERIVTVSGSVVIKMKHGGPSGMPLQSKVNDVLMQVFMERLMERLQASQSVESSIEAVGKELHLIARLEDQVALKARSVHQALEQRAFLFVGYYFYVERGGSQVSVVADLPRALAQLPYPTQQGYRDQAEHDWRMALKLAGVAVAAGVFPQQQYAAWRALLDGGKRVLASARQGMLRAQDVLEEHVFAGLQLTVTSGDGLAAVLERGRLHEIWQDKPRQVFAMPALIDVKRQLRKKKQPLKEGDRQQMEPVGNGRAGRPPRRVSRALVLKNLRAELAAKGGLEKMSKSRRGNLLYLVGLENNDMIDEDTEDDGDYSEYESVDYDADALSDDDEIYGNKAYHRSFRDDVHREIANMS